MASLQTQPAPLHVVIVGYNRPASLARLVHSLERADYGKTEQAAITIDFALDHTGNETVTREIDAVVRGISWPHGAVRVSRRKVRAGLRDNVLGAWLPASDASPPAVLLEDDIEVSALWWHWVQAALGRYRRIDGLLGISLFTPDDLNEQYRNRGGADACGWQALHARSQPAEARQPALLFAQPCSWGALFFASAWRGFLRQAATLRRLDRAQLPHLPCAPGSASDSQSPCQVVANRWGASSWKRLLLLHMFAHGLHMVYPNLPHRASFSTNHVEPGSHLAHSPRAELAGVLAGQRARHRVALVTPQHCAEWRMHCRFGEPEPGFELPSPERIALWDMYCNQSLLADGGTAALREAGKSMRARLPDVAPELEVKSEDVDEITVLARARAPPRLARPLDEL